MLGLFVIRQFIKLNYDTATYVEVVAAITAAWISPVFDTGSPKIKKLS